MNRLEKELRKRGITYVADDIAIMMRGPEYDEDAVFYAIEGNILIVKWTSAVLQPMFRLYEAKTLKYIGEQNVQPEADTRNRWWSFADVEPDDVSDADFMAGMTWDDIYGI